MSRAFEVFFYKTFRRDGQTLMSYLAEHREALQEVEKHGVVIPDKIGGWLLLRRSGLTMAQKQMLQSKAPELTHSTVTEALYYLFGQDYKGKVSDGKTAWRSGKVYSSGRRWTRSPNYLAEEVYEAEEAQDWPEEVCGEEWEPPEDEIYVEEIYDDETYHSYLNEQPDLDEEFYSELVLNYEDAYAAYLDARRQMANLKASRGYYPVVALADSSPIPAPTGGAPLPQSSKRAGKPKGKNKGKGKARPKAILALRGLLHQAFHLAPRDAGEARQ